MYRYQILIEYIGTNFIGWQIQAKGQSIQRLLQNKQTTKIYDLVKSEKITSSKYIDSCIVTNSNIKNIKMGQMVKNLVNITEEDKKKIRVN